MSMQLRLAAKAQELRRRVFASLPRGYRLMMAFVRLSLDASAEAFGLLVYSEFLRAGVKGMPDVNGQPATSLDVSSPRLINKLPRNYGAALGEKALATLKQLGFSPSDAHDMIQEYSYQILKGHKISGEHDLKGASSYVLDGLKKAALTKMKKDRGRAKHHGPGGSTNDEGEYVEIDSMDPHALQQLEHEMTHEQIYKLMEELSHINKGLPKYFELVMKGHPDSEIIDDKMVPEISEKFTGKNPRVPFNRWKMLTVMPAIQKFLREHGGDN